MAGEREIAEKDRKGNERGEVWDKMRLLGEKLRSEDKEYGLISVGGEEMGEGVQKKGKGKGRATNRL